MNDIERLETKIAFVEAANAELSDAVYRQQKELDAVRAQLQALLGRVEELQHKSAEWAPQDEVPPHY
jgi:SlyX protein